MGLMLGALGTLFLSKLNCSRAHKVNFVYRSTNSISVLSFFTTCSLSADLYSHRNSHHNGYECQSTNSAYRLLFTT